MVMFKKQGIIILLFVFTWNSWESNTSLYFYKK